MQQQPAGRPAPQRARGKGRLVTKSLGGRTRLAELFQEGCAKIRLPETFSDELEAILINSSGGLTGGDRLEWGLRAGPGTHVTVTTQANEKVYKAAADTAHLITRIEAAEDTRVFWLPQETILFDRASLTRELEVDLAANAEFLAVEAMILGRTAMGERADHGLFRDRWRIRRNGRLIHAEEVRFEDEITRIGSHAATLGTKVAFATVLYSGPSCEIFLPRLKPLLEHGYAGASHWQDKLVVRIAASDGFALRKILSPVISLLRNGAPVPKVWNI
ncbi:urease accessory protein UreD [Rhizobium oryzicola]|uniref:Urease accessory protein UreD n=1 Tax=Rhizobium oryzicola TaxID=1232668 RepID=A0ABT8SUR3_9HYPH|nr:urease accessory protein UreD [Rhizobium oryzicola]MDO1582163.1 urease accessory protein UreD [Rhizobium oryzicola]